MAKLIDGKAISAAVRAEVARGVAEFTKQHGRAPGLHVVLAGSDPASAVYVRNKEKNAKEVGIAGQVHRLPDSVTQAELMDLVQQLNQDPAVDGFIVQLPLYPGLEAEPVLDARGIEYYLVENDTDAPRISIAFEEAAATKRPVAVLVGDEFHGFNRPSLDQPQDLPRS